MELKLTAPASDAAELRRVSWTLVVFGNHLAPMRYHLLTAVLLIASAQNGAGAQDVAKLRATKTFRCVFTLSASVNMDADAPKAASRPDNLELVFDQVDITKRSGRIIGNAGAEDVTVIAGDERVTLLEATGSGTIQVTVIYVAQRSDGQFKAVHSRHTAMPGGIPIASQMYGSCRPLD